MENTKTVGASARSGYAIFGVDGLKAGDYRRLTNKEIAIYDETAVDSKDLYDYYLSGAKALLKITNPKATSDKELIIFVQNKSFHI